MIYLRDGQSPKSSKEEVAVAFKAMSLNRGRD